MTEFLYRDASGQTQRKDVDYAELINVPADFPATPHTHDWTTDITGKPATFPPDAHSHNHDELGDLTSDDHPQYHTDARGDARYSLLGHDHDAEYSPLGHVHVHADTTGLGADDHPQYYDTFRGDARWAANQHALYGLNHFDVDTVPAIKVRDGLFWRTADDKWQVEQRMNWRSAWVAGTYYKHDVVTDEGFTMIANKQTTDQAAPQIAGPPAFALPDVPVWIENTAAAVAYTGVDFTLAVDGAITGVRGWIPRLGLQVTAYLLDITTDPDAAELIDQVGLDGLVPTTGWVNAPFQPRIFRSGTALRVLLVTRDFSADIPWDHQWTYEGTTVGDPLTAEFKRDAGFTELYIHEEDDDTVDRGMQIGDLAIGDELQVEEAADPSRFDTYRIAATPTYSSPVWTVSVVRIGNGSAVRLNKLCNLTAELIATEHPSPYVQLTDYWLANAPATVSSVKGWLGATYTPLIGELNDNAYGVDIQAVELLQSPDWDIIHFVAGATGNSGTSGHFLYGPLHQDVDDTTPIQTRQLLTSDELTVFRPDYRNNWVGAWVPATYEKSDMVIDGPYTMIANKQTVDRAAPEPTGEVAWASGFDDAPPWLSPTNSAATMFSGQRYTASAGAQIHAYRIWIPVADATVDYELWLIRNPLTAPSVEVIIPRFNATVTGWRTIPVVVTPIFPGTVLDIVLVQHSNTTPTVFAATWAQKNINGDPTSGEANFLNNQVELRIHHEDEDTTNRQAALEAILVGAALIAAGMQWTVTATSHQANHVRFELTPFGLRPPEGDVEYTFSYGTAIPLTYVRVVDHWLGDPRAQGFISLDGTYPALTLDDDAYGVDLLYDNLILSPDWDIVGHSGSSFGSGGAGNVPFPEAPVDGATYGRKGEDASWQVVYTKTVADSTFAAIVHTHTQSDITDFGGPYLPLTGGTVTGDVTAAQSAFITDGAFIVNDALGGAGQQSTSVAVSAAITTHVNLSRWDINGITNALYLNSNRVLTTLDLDPLTFPLLAPNGSEAAPSYSFTNDGGTGWWRRSTTEINLSLTGVEKLRFDAAQLNFLDAYDLRMFGPGNVARMDLQHTGAAMDQKFVLTTNWNITGLTGVMHIHNQVNVNDGKGLFLVNVGAYTGFIQGVSDFSTDFVGNTDWTITGLVGKVAFGSIPIEAGRFTSASNSQTTIIDFYATANGNFGAVNGMNFYCDTLNANTSDSFRWWANAVGNGSADLLMKLNQQGGLELATVRIEGTGDVGLTSTAHGFQIGPTTGVNLAMDGNEIMARNNSAASPLYINHEGGQVYLNGGRLIVDTGSIISTQVFRGPNGTAALPAYSFSGDTNTGIYWIGADVIGFAIGGAEAFRIHPSVVRSTKVYQGPNGSVSSPTYGFTNDPDTGWYLVTTSNIGMALAGVQKISCGTSAFSVLTPLWVQNGTAAAPSLTFASDTNTGMFRQAADKLGFTTAGGERLRLSSTGITAYTKLLMNNNEVQAGSGSTRIKYTVWNNGVYSVGMGASYTLGDVSSYCMTFQMGTPDNYGFWWGKSSHTNAQGAMTLSNRGYLYVLANIEVAGNTVWHAGNDGAGSGLDADLLDGLNQTSAATGSTIMARNSSGDTYARLFRSTYQNQTSMAATATMCFRTNTSDNYIRHCTAAGVVAWLNTEGGLEADPVGGPFLPLSGGLMTGTLSLQGTGANNFQNGTGDGASYTTHNFKFQGWQGMALTDHANVVHGTYNFRTGLWYVDRGLLIKNDGTFGVPGIAWDAGFGIFVDGNIWRFSTVAGTHLFALDPVSAICSIGMTLEVNGRVRVPASLVTPISTLELCSKAYVDSVSAFLLSDINTVISNTPAAPPDPTGVTVTDLGGTIWTAAWDEEGLGVHFEIEIDVGGGGFVPDRFTRGGMFVYGKTNPQSAQFRVRAHTIGGGVSNWVNSAVI